MIKLEKTEVVGWEPAIRGMRNPKNSWDRMDSIITWPDHSEPIIRCMNCIEDCDVEGDGLKNICIGPNDHKLMMNLAAGGPVHAKYRRMITVYVDITAPLYWWKEFDTYKVGTVANSCSTMHKIHDKEFTLEDFSCEHLGFNDDTAAHCLMSNGDNELDPNAWLLWPYNLMLLTISMLNSNRNMFLKTNDKKYWWQMIQLLPSSYNQKRTIMLNYEVLAGIYPMRKNHKLDEWHVFCDWIKSLPYSEIITGPRDGKAFFDGSVNVVENPKEKTITGA